jgi:cytochrome c peroxidase
MGGGLRLDRWTGIWHLAFWLLILPLAAAAQDAMPPLPRGVLPPDIPPGNPLTAPKIELGKKLYFDPRLSRDNTVSCATCHDPGKGFAEHDAVSTGVGGAKGVRNAPTVLNAAFLRDQFWDGRAATLEDQALQPLVNPVEMAMADHASVATKLQGLAEYGPLFERAFGDSRVTIQRVVQAIASFERTLLDVEAPIDRFLAGNQGAISESAKRGWTLFNGKARCSTCHGYVSAFPLFTDEQYRNIGVAAKAVNFNELAGKVERHPETLPQLSHEEGINQLGRFLVTHERKDIGAFKTPQLRNIALTAPYMHDGSEKTLLDVIEFYDRGGNPNPWIDGGMRPLGLTSEEKADLVELLKTFTGEHLDRFEALSKLMPTR